jgi:hypothetical protein
MPNAQFSDSDYRTFRDELDRRDSHRFTELEVKSFLLSILPQLANLDSQDQTHIPISLDTLVFSSSQVTLRQSDSTIDEHFDWRHDIFALGIVAIQMLTGKTEAELQTSNGDWNWEDECVVSDQTAQLINQMLGANVPAIKSLQEILQILRGERPSYSVGSQSLPVNKNGNSQLHSVDSYVHRAHHDRRSFPTQQPPKLKPKYMFMGLALAGILLGAIALPSFHHQSQRAKQARGLTLLGSILHAHMRELPDNLNLELTASLENLEIGVDWDDELYRYEQTLLNDAQLVVTATARQKHLRSYSGALFFAEIEDGKIGLHSAICQTVEPSQIPPQWPELTRTAVLCPAGSTLIGDALPAIEIYLSRAEIFDEIEAHAEANRQTHYTFDLADFPKPVCGDPLPTSRNAYPVNFYPVFVNFSDRNLSVVKTRFCNDSLPVFRESKGRKYVQV